MKVVYKYKIPIQDYISLSLPVNAKIIKFDSQNNDPYIWVLVTLEKELEERKFRLAGTGHDIRENNLKYIDTTIMHDGQLVWHLFEIVKGCD